MAISKRVKAAMERASWIRRMFEEGIELKRRHGEAAVCDLSLGNPDLEPPAGFSTALAALAADPTPGQHRYMPNAGLLEARTAVAAFVAREHGVDPTADGICMTVGAAGAANVLFKSLLDPGSEVLVPAPFFPEYEFWADNHGGRLVTVPTRPDFSLDLEAFDRAIGPATRIVLVNSPNNPTGRVYPAADLAALGQLLDRRAPEATLVADEPYRRLIFGGVKVPSVLAATRRSAIVSSFSKDLGLAGERIGFLAIHPEHPDRAGLRAAATFANRTLGFVNAPALLQRLVARLTHQSVDVKEYEARLELLLAGLARAGWSCVRPEGGMFVFPATPEPDDVAFAQRLAHDEKVLVVPGTGFGCPGHVRISLAVSRDVIERALPRLARAARQPA
jgi:aspartate aminotransferase